MTSSHTPRGPTREGRSRAGNLLIAILTVVGILMLISSAVFNSSPLFVWNGFDSVPQGLYIVRPGAAVNKGRLVLARLPLNIQRFAEQAGYLPEKTAVLKYVSAVAGDVVCRFNNTIHINGKKVAVALPVDSSGISLPICTGCHTLQYDKVFLLGTHDLSFDSRYFGSIKRNNIIGRAYLIW